MNTNFPDSQEINEYIKEYLRFVGLHSTLDHFESECKSKPVSQKLLQKVTNSKQEDLPRIYTLLKQDNFKVKG